MSKRVAGNKGFKARSFQYFKMSRQVKSTITRLRQHEKFITETHKKGELDTEKFDVPQELANIGERIKTFFRRHRDR